MSRSASGSAIFPKRDSTCQRRARKPSTWSVMPATPKRIPAGQLCASPACTMSATKTGMTARRASVSAFGSCASGAGIAEVAIPEECTGRLLQGMKPRRPERGAEQIGHLRSGTLEPPRPVVREIPTPRRGGLDLRALPPLVEARDRDAVGARPNRRLPEVVVGRAVSPAARQRDLSRTNAVVARADAGHAQEPVRMRLGAQPHELPPAVVDEVIRVEAVEAARHGESDELRPREGPSRRRPPRRPPRPVGRGEIARVVDVDVADPE